MVLAQAGATGPRTNHATRSAALNISPPARQGCQVTATPGRSGASADPRVTPSGGDYDPAEGKVAGGREQADGRRGRRTNTGACGGSLRAARPKGAATSPRSWPRIPGVQPP